MYDFAENRSGQHAHTFLDEWSGKLVCDDYVGYKPLFEKRVVEVGCMAHARRKFDELYANHRSELAAAAVELFGKLYIVEREAREQNLMPSPVRGCAWSGLARSPTCYTSGSSLTA